MYFKWFLFISIYLSANFTFAQNSSTFTFSPLKHCEEFKVEVEYHTNYKLSFKTSPDVLAETKTLYVKDLINLESVTSILAETAETFCPLSLEQVSIDGIFTCQKKHLGPKPFSKDYIDFLNNVIELTNQSLNKCSKVSSLIKLQLQISQLDKNKILKMKEANDILKLFTGDKTDDIIDLYHECKTEGDSKSFITNLILLEGKNQCLFPTPPGQLSYNEFHKIAKAAGEKFKNKGLISLNNKKNDITKFVVKHTAETVLRKVAVTLLPKNQVEDILKRSNIIQELDSVKPELISDYTKYVLPNRAPLKLIDIALLPMVQNKFKAPLKGISNSEVLIKDTLYPLVKDSFNSCIEGFKDDLEYGTKRTVQEDIEFFKDQENSFCEKNTEECNKISCDRKINFSTTDGKITDTGRIQACIFKAFNAGLEATLNSILVGQYNSLSGSLSIEGDKIHELSTLSAAHIQTCTKQSLKHELKEIPNPEYDIYHYASAEEFINSLGICVKKEEEKITRFFSLEILNNMEVFKKNFPTKQGNLLAISIVDQALESCLRTQKKRVDNTKVSPSLCKPIIELTGAAALVPQILKKTMNDKNVAPKVIENITREFNSCSKTSIEKANSDLFNKKGSPPFLGPKENDSYIVNNSSFFTCFSKGLNQTTSSIIDKTFLDHESELGKEVVGKENLKKVLVKGKKLTMQCFDQFYSQIESWPNFLALNDTGFIENVKEICTERATKSILPNIAIHETNIRLKEVLKSKLLTKDLKELLEDVSPVNGSNNEKILSLRADFLKKHPEKKNKEFTNHFTTFIRKKIFKDIHKNIFSNIREHNLNAYEVDTLEKTITPQCINSLHLASNNWPELKSKKEKAEEDKQPEENKRPKLSLTDFLGNLISNAINYTSNLDQFHNFNNKIKIICSSPQGYKGLAELLKDGAITPIIASETAIKVKKAFTSFATKQCLEDLKEYKIDITTRNKDIICSEKVLTKNEVKHFIHNALQDSKDKALIVRFILERKNKTLEVINKKLTDAYIWKIMNANQSISDYISNNLVDFIKEDEEIVGSIYQKVIKGLFSNRDKDSFTDRFLSNQIIHTIGISGYEKAKKVVIHRKNNLEGVKENIFQSKVRPEIMKQFYSRWNPAGIRYLLNWDDTPKTKKNKLFEIVLNKKILPMYDTKLSDGEKDLREKEMKDLITDYVMNASVFPVDQSLLNRKVSGNAKRGHNNNIRNAPRTFIDKLTFDITKAVTGNVTDDVISVINPLD